MPLTEQPPGSEFGVQVIPTAAQALGVGAHVFRTHTQRAVLGKGLGPGSRPHMRNPAPRLCLPIKFY